MLHCMLLDLPCPVLVRNLSPLFDFEYGSFSFVPMSRMGLFPAGYVAGWTGRLGTPDREGQAFWLGWPDQPFLPEDIGWPHQPEAADWYSVTGQTGLASLPSRDSPATS